MSQTIYYEPGAIRWRRYQGSSDVREYRPTRGWEAFAELLDIHPVTGVHLRNGPQWWIRETFVGDT